MKKKQKIFNLCIRINRWRKLKKHNNSIIKPFLWLNPVWIECSQIPYSLFFYSFTLFRVGSHIYRNARTFLLYLILINCSHAWRCGVPRYMNMCGVCVRVCLARAITHVCAKYMKLLLRLSIHTFYLLIYFFFSTIFANSTNLI